MSVEGGHGKEQRVKKPLSPAARAAQDARINNPARYAEMRVKAADTLKETLADKKAREGVKPKALKPKKYVQTEREAKMGLVPMEKLTDLLKEEFQLEDEEAKVAELLARGEIELHPKTGEVIPLYEQPED